MCEDRGAAGPEGGEVWGGGIPLPSRLGGLGEHFKHILRSQSGSGRRENATFFAAHFQ